MTANGHWVIVVSPRGDVVRLTDRYNEFDDAAALFGMALTGHLEDGTEVTVRGTHVALAWHEDDPKAIADRVSTAGADVEAEAAAFDQTIPKQPAAALSHDDVMQVWVEHERRAAAGSVLVTRQVIVGLRRDYSRLADLIEAADSEHTDHLFIPAVLVALGVDNRVTESDVGLGWYARAARSLRRRFDFGDLDG